MKKLQILLLVTVSIMMSGCESLSLHQANAALTNYYLALQSAAQQSDFITAQTSKDALADLARQASEQAEKASDTALKIALHRAAATAAWKADMPNAQQFASAGNSVCNSQFAAAPSHCGMLALIPNMIEIDRITAQANALISAVQNGEISANDNNADALRIKLQDYFDNYKSRANTVVSDYSQVKQNQNTEQILAGFDTQTEVLFCKHLPSVNDAILKMEGPNRSNICDIYAVKTSAQNAGMSGGCLSESLDKPSWCN
ncbi:hypothetical protein PN836_014430 [Ningiella sp. W23]|uniref:hypothetical protein n=1 Tax=Ningiella sp. W23 TaxID=3023715 RepID=UPI003757F164